MASTLDIDSDGRPPVRQEIAHNVARVRYEVPEEMIEPPKAAALKE
jgi:hypothetical protein